MIQNPRLRQAFEALKTEWDTMYKVSCAADSWLKEQERESKHMPSVKKADDALAAAVKAWRKIRDGFLP